jgi:voltage-gated potassium channel
MGRAERVERILEWPMIVAALLVIPVVVIEDRDYGEPWETLGDVLNWATWFAFLGEAVVMLVLVRDRRTWARKNWLDLAIVVLTPPFLSALAPVRLFRLLRLLRLVRLTRVARRLFTQAGLQAAALLSALVAVAGGLSYSVVENTTPAEGFYWALTTMTTVGYGDPHPTTTAGKILAMVVMVVGIGFVAILTGALAQGFVQGRLDEETTEIEHELDEASAEILGELRAVRSRLDTLEASLINRATRTGT